jgi:hypothetical protein
VFLGPLAGGPFETGDKTPRSVMKEYFDVVCPHPKILDKKLVRATLPENYSAKTVMEAWLKLLKETPDNCVEIDDKIFDIWLEFPFQSLAKPNSHRSPLCFYHY